MNDGLPETVLHWVIQDQRGFIWVVTYDELSRFDGYSFKTYTYKPTSRKSLGHNNVSTLLEDSIGRLWISNRRGLELFNPTTEQFQLLATDLNNAAKFRVRKDGKLWICAQGIYIANTQTLSIERMTGLPDDYYWDIAEARDGSLWAAGDNGVVHIDSKTGRTSVYRHDPNDPTSLSRSHTLSIFIDEQDRVWIGGWGLNLFDPINKSFTRFLTTNDVR
ncbi:MAG: ligand-binding sensor domain-containing protein, partial [Nitrososphaeraceae archaeon]